jgi:hypothetical protein
VGRDRRSSEEGDVPLTVPSPCFHDGRRCVSER